MQSSQYNHHNTTSAPRYNQRFWAIDVGGRDIGDDKRNRIRNATHKIQKAHDCVLLAVCAGGHGAGDEAPEISVVAEVTTLTAMLQKIVEDALVAEGISNNAILQSEMRYYNFDEFAIESFRAYAREVTDISREAQAARASMPRSMPSFSISVDLCSIS